MTRFEGRLIVRLTMVFVVVILAIAAVSAIVYGRLNDAPAQPIPFSHRIHAGTKQLNCIFCHPSALRSQNAGIPSVEKCLLCHNVIASNFRPIAKIRGYFDRNEPIPWVRVYKLPDFVHFSHQAHLTNSTKWGKKFDCSVCHGDVKSMDRIRLNEKMEMRFCVNCHRKYNFNAYCFTCHW